MEKTLGLLGDLCCEAEQTWRRMRSVRRCLTQCQDSGLQKRLLIEASQHASRGQTILDIIEKSSIIDFSNSFQVQFLKEMLYRILAEEQILQKC